MVGLGYKMDRGRPVHSAFAVPPTSFATSADRGFDVEIKPEGVRLGQQDQGEPSRSVGAKPGCAGQLCCAVVLCRGDRLASGAAGRRQARVIEMLLEL
jgi:hypothetical protein